MLFFNNNHYQNSLFNYVRILTGLFTGFVGEMVGLVVGVIRYLKFLMLKIMQASLLGLT